MRNPLSFDKPATDSPSSALSNCTLRARNPSRGMGLHPGCAASGHPPLRFRMKPQAFKTKGGSSTDALRAGPTHGALLALR